MQTRDVDQGKGGDDAPKLESFEVVLVHCNLVNNTYPQTSKVLFIFVPNKQLGQSATIAPHSLTMLDRTSTDFSSIEEWLTDRNSTQLETEDNVNIPLIVG